MVVYNERGEATTNAEPHRDVYFEIALHVTETREDFIFTTLSKYIGEISKIIIPKQLIKRAVQCFYEEHREEFDRFVEEMDERDNE